MQEHLKKRCTQLIFKLSFNQLHACRSFGVIFVSDLQMMIVFAVGGTGGDDDAGGNGTSGGGTGCDGEVTMVVTNCGAGDGGKVA